jgi:hypothetical protein
MQSYDYMSACLSNRCSIIESHESNVELLFGFFNIVVIALVSSIVWYDVDHWLPLHKVKSIKKKVKTTYRHTAHSFIQPLLKRDRFCMHAIVGLLSDRMLERSSVYICISDEGHQILLLCSFKLISSSPSLCFLILINQKEQVNSWRNKVRDIIVVQSIIDDKTFGIWYSTNCIDILLYK